MELIPDPACSHCEIRGKKVIGKKVIGLILIPLFTNYQSPITFSFMIEKVIFEKKVPLTPYLFINQPKMFENGLFPIDFDRGLF